VDDQEDRFPFYLVDDGCDDVQFEPSVVGTDEQQAAMPAGGANWSTLDA
jgi:hypothetical protein